MTDGVARSRIRFVAELFSTYAFLFYKIMKYAAFLTFLRHLYFVSFHFLFLFLVITFTFQPTVVARRRFYALSGLLLDKLWPRVGGVPSLPPVRSFVFCRA